MKFNRKIFTDLTDQEFNAAALTTFRFQYDQNETYRLFADSVGAGPDKVKTVQDIPFLPISFFKTHTLVTGTHTAEKIFTSSGTTGSVKSRHAVTDLSIYRQSLLAGFQKFYGDPASYDLYALMPSPEENPGSSLVFMVNEWRLQQGGAPDIFYLNRFEELAERLAHPVPSGKKRLIIGLTYALLDFTEQFPMQLPGIIIMETGGMKGRREEMIREELHDLLINRFGVNTVHSEYGMTELLSQAWSKGEGIFYTPGWMKILIREMNDPFSYLPGSGTGGINIIDLANFNSCSFIATEDLGKAYSDGSFEVLGRYDNSDIRGCSLMMS